MYIEKKNLYNSEDIQRMLNFLSVSNKALSRFKKALNGYSTQDINAILSTIRYCNADDFNIFDSAVCEIFIREFENCFLTKRGISQYLILAESDDNIKFKVVDLSDKCIELLTKSDLDRARNLGIDIREVDIK